jgi:hypothetical protein
VQSCTGAGARAGAGAALRIGEKCRINLALALAPSLALLRTKRCQFILLSTTEQNGVSSFCWQRQNYVRTKWCQFNLLPSEQNGVSSICCHQNKMVSVQFVATMTIRRN